MKIQRGVYEQLLKCPQVPPETGGILGGNHSVIHTVRFDRGALHDPGVTYMPNTVFLNRCIKAWSTAGIDFYGIFHTHAQQWPTLSGADKGYVHKIMWALPSSVQELYFPLVFPGCTVKWFRAHKTPRNVYLSEIAVEIVEQEGR